MVLKIHVETLKLAFHREMSLSIVSEGDLIQIRFQIRFNLI